MPHYGREYLYGPDSRFAFEHALFPVKLDVDSQDTITCDNKRKTVQRCYFDVWNLSVLPAFVLIAPKGLSIMTVKDSYTAEEMKYLLYQILEKEKEWISK